MLSGKNWKFLVFLAVALALSSWAVLYIESDSVNSGAFVALVIMTSVLWAGLGIFKYALPLSIVSALATGIALFATELSLPLVILVLAGGLLVWHLQPKRGNRGEIGG